MKRAEMTVEYDKRLRKIGQTMIDDHCPRGWKFDIENLDDGRYPSRDRHELWRAGIKATGRTNYTSRTISVDFRLLSNRVPEREIVDIIRHEIAHVLAGRRAASHGKRWHRIAEKIGVSPKNLINQMLMDVQECRLRRERAAGSSQ